MLKTKFVYRCLIGLALIGLFFGHGQASTAVAAATVSQTSHATSTNKASAVSSKAKVSKKAQLAKKAALKAPSLRGLASIYSDKLSGRKTASGQRFCQKKMTAAHRSLPIGTRVLVTNLHNNKTVEVFINDRGPHYRDRVIDLTSAAASQLGMKKKGFFRVKLEVLKKPMA